MNKTLKKSLLQKNIKNELLCYGVRVTPEALSYINMINPYISNKSIHPASFYIENKKFINIQFNEKYNLLSPYLIEYESNDLYLTKNRNKICKINLKKAPLWYKNTTSNGVLMYDVFNVHGDSVLALSNYEGCSYASIGQKCKFCSFLPSNLSYDCFNSRVNDIIETLTCAFEDNPNYSIALSEGTKASNDRGALFFSNIAREIVANFGNVEISAELAPPKDFFYIDNMINSGVTSLIMNIELFDDAIRKSICPGKSEITIEQYMKALSYSVERLGVGNVSSVLIAGIEPIENTIICAKKLLHIGVIPTIIPFKPYDNCELHNQKITDPVILQIINEEISNEKIKISFPNVDSHSCIGCGACNVIKI